ncbi:hypothetical protein [Arenibacter algicola]|uniref:Restriction endonuclease n=1 Tax=Arenibacter algicola TaxID=616991 RepID=A0A221UXJ3_9FLAO|nr:hypothetical protein [Arenibacter algicola]ASO06042.1 hypothetical protein AREALGSMS7_02599 [Arenibacter algicola]|tara:strand:+ start:4715 stop:5788 length:1074 start_codon:yes stop_codon:yes gene_type:complete
MSIPNIPSLSKIIHHGSEGGQEFARVMNQLLFEDSQLYDYHFQSYSDSAGDFKGVDAIIERGLKKIGLQYKFFEGDPKKGKAGIKKSLINAIDSFPDMDEWVLVTPDNFTTHGMTWLNELSLKFDVRVKHWGHSEILNFMLKFPQIGKKYYSNEVFRSQNAYLDREPTKAEINAFFSQFNNPEVDQKMMFFQAQPNLNDFRKIFSNNIYREVSDLYYLLYSETFNSDIMATSKKLGGAIKVGVSSVDDIEKGVDQLPGGMSMAFKEFDCFQKNVSFYSVNVGGVSFSVWCFVNGRWVFISKPWRIINTIYGLRNNSGINRIIKWLRWLGYGKFLRTENSASSKTIVSRIIHGLSTKK